MLAPSSIPIYRALIVTKFFLKKSSEISDAGFSKVFKLFHPSHVTLLVGRE